MLSSIGIIKQVLFKVLAGLLATGVVVTATVVGVSYLRPDTPVVDNEPQVPDAGESQAVVWTLTVEDTLDLTEGNQYSLLAKYVCDEESESEDAQAPELNVVWTSSDTSIATVDSTGLVTAHAPGVATITVSAQDESTSAVCTVTVTKKPEVIIKVQQVQVPEKMTLTIGEEDHKNIGCTLQPQDAKNVTVTYQTSDAKVATVDDQGIVRAVGNGTCTIKATAINQDGSAVFAETAVTVHTKAKKLGLPGKLSLLAGKTGTLSLQISPASADTGVKITWASSNKKVVTVNQKGQVKAVAAGTATVTATNELGLVAKCTVTVTEPVVEKPVETPVEKPVTNACTYCKKEGHKEAKCPQKAVDNGAIGRWIIEDVNVNVAVYKGTSSAQKNSAIVDAKDSGIYLKKGDGYLIGDHNYQGFEAIKKCKPGTVAYLVTGTRVEEYVCTRVFKGYNEKYYLTDAKGVKYIMDRDYVANYTCNENSHSITIVEFKPVSIADKSSGSVVSGADMENMLTFFEKWKHK